MSGGLATTTDSSKDLEKVENTAMVIAILERDMTEAEYARELEGFREHALSFGVPDMPETRHGFVVVDGEAFIGSVSGLQYGQWFYITDLWLENPIANTATKPPCSTKWKKKPDSLESSIS